ncbi:VCBS repeat-containing protein, partial [Kitasatospora sp. NPDC005856]|uniref:FG-GAP repeat domain-containing protein n=1 Tax=Kitasatospora sp. NPDC005856 TaxID=3154566 RepID=UPI0033E9E87F
PFGVADWDGDGHQDIVVRNDASGDLLLYPGEGTRGYSSAQPVKIGNSWLPYSPFGVTDWDHDGHQDVIARDNDSGKLWLYPGDGSRGYSSFQRVEIGNGWAGYSSFGLADWDRDGHQDIVARNDASGDLLLYPGESSRGYSSAQPVKIGNGW